MAAFWRFLQKKHWENSMKEKFSFILDESKKILNSTKSRLNTFKEKIYTAINGAPEQTNEETIQEEQSEPVEKPEQPKSKRKTRSKEKPQEEAQTQTEAQNDNATNKKENIEKTTTLETTKPAGKEYSTFGELSLLFFLAILDTIASLVFIAAIVIAIKPALLRGSVNPNAYEFSSIMKKIGNAFLRIEFTKYNGDNNLRVLQSFTTGIGLIIFTIIKIFILTAARNGTRKAISVLTLAMTLLACFIMPDKFLLFLMFVVLLHIVFEYSCGFPSALVFVKFGFIVAAAIACYIAIHFAFDQELAPALQKILDAIKLPSLRWW